MQAPARRKLARAALGAAAVVAIAAGLGALARSPAPAAPARDPAARAAAPRLPGSAVRGRGAEGSGVPVDEAALTAYLRARYGAHIDDAYVQMQLVEKLMRHFQASQPATWREALLAAVRAAFPDRAAGIAALLQQRLDYEAWIAQSRDRLARLDDRARRDALWEERKRIFGEAAAAEIWAAERQGQALADAVAAIDASPGASVSERLARYRASIEEIHAERAAGYLERHRQEALGRFLALASVQRELSALPPAERAESLRAVRRGLGLDEAALARWDALDRERDQRWDAGARYMAERAALASRFSGEALEAQLAPVRARYFASEATTIAAEEASGFFRFAAARRHGLD
jgi:hypothetical protein